MDWGIEKLQARVLNFLSLESIVVIRYLQNSFNYFLKERTVIQKLKRSGKTNRVEPSDMTWAKTFPHYAKLFQEAGWFQYFEKINGYHS